MAKILSRLTKDRNVSVDYDKHADVLYVVLGEPVPAEGEYSEDIIFRYAMKDGSPCGATIIGYRKNHWDSKSRDLSEIISKHLSVPLSEVLGAINEIRISS